MKNKNALAVLALLAVLLTGVAIIQFLSRPNYMEIAQSRVKIGIKRGEMIQALSDAWYHGICYYSDSTADDLFLYGPRNRDRVTVIEVRSISKNGELMVDFVGGFENYIYFESGFGRDYYPRCMPAEFFNN